MFMLIIKKDILILAKGQTQGLEHKWTVEKMSSINFAKKIKKSFFHKKEILFKFAI